MPSKILIIQSSYLSEYILTLITVAKFDHVLFLRQDHYRLFIMHYFQCN